MLEGLRPSKTPLTWNFFRAGNPARDGAGSSYGRVGQIHLRFRAAHPPHEVAVGGGDAGLALGQYAHVPAQAGAAGRRADDGVRVEEDLEEAFCHGRPVDLRRRGNDDQANMRGCRSALEHLGGDPQILDAAVGAGPDKDLIDPDTDRAGLLYDLLGVFARRNINLTRIESRPSKRGIGKYVFFLDYAVSGGTCDALRDLKEITIAKEIGCYARLEVP